MTASSPFSLIPDDAPTPDTLNYHVYPDFADEPTHILFAGRCWCEPEIRFASPGRFIVVHRRTC